jgi:oligopeptide/dipeptide ABC transporter ATP-binding protein
MAETPLGKLEEGVEARPSSILSVRDLVTSYHTGEGKLRVVDGVSFDIRRSATLAIIGESGCGKSATALSIMRLISSPLGQIESGKIELEGRDLLTLSERDMCQVRGRALSMVFQEPMTSLHPLVTIGWQIQEAVTIRERVSRRQARARTMELLERVCLPEPGVMIDTYPHRLSGGQRQRVMIAMALACEPALLLLDDPTTALDVSTQAQIFELLRNLQRRCSMSMLLVTHDLRRVFGHASDVVVMYAGRVVESGSVADVFAKQMHPYTRGLIESIPEPGTTPHRRLRTIEGSVPDLRRLGVGCRFAQRCPMRIDLCEVEEPPLMSVATGRSSRCWRHDEVPS